MKKIILATLFIPTLCFAQSQITENKFKENLKKEQTQTQQSFYDNFSPYNISLGNNHINTPHHVISTNIDGSTTDTQNDGISTDMTGETNININNKHVNLGTNFTTSSPVPANEETVASANYRACIRVLLNSNDDLQTVLKKCASRNPRAILVSTHNDDDTVAKSNDEFINKSHNYIIGADKADKKDGLIIPQDTSIPPVYSGPISNADCDISRDIKVILSPKCMSETDANIASGTGAVPVPLVASKELLPIKKEEVSHIENQSLCEYSFNDSPSSSFKPNTATDCLKRAISLTHNKEGELHIILTNAVGSVSSAVCQISKNSKPQCSLN